MALSEGEMDATRASLLLQTVEPDIGMDAAALMPPEVKLTVLRFGVEVAVADGAISAEEMKALRSLAATLALPPAALDALLVTVVTPTDETEEALRTLGLGPDATTAEIRVAHRSLILRWHPDKASEADKAEATRRSSKINAAYDHLMAKNSR